MRKITMVVSHPSVWVLFCSIVIGIFAQSPQVMWTRLSTYFMGGIAVSQSFICLRLALKRGPTKDLAGHGLIALGAALGAFAFLSRATRDVGIAASAAFLAGSLLLARSHDDLRQSGEDASTQ